MRRGPYSHNSRVKPDRRGEGGIISVVPLLLLGLAAHCCNLGHVTLQKPKTVCSDLFRAGSQVAPDAGGRGDLRNRRPEALDGSDFRKTRFSECAQNVPPLHVTAAGDAPIVLACV